GPGGFRARHGPGRRVLGGLRRRRGQVADESGPLHRGRAGPGRGRRPPSHRDGVRGDAAVITQFVVTLIIAGVWMFLQETPAWENFVVGFVLGLVVMQLAVRRLDTPFWLHRVLAFVKLSFVFLAEVVRSGVRVSYLILHPKLPIRPGLVAVRLGGTRYEARTSIAVEIKLAPCYDSAWRT